MSSSNRARIRTRWLAIAAIGAFGLSGCIFGDTPKPQLERVLASTQPPPSATDVSSVGKLLTDAGVPCDASSVGNPIPNFDPKNLVEKGSCTSGDSDLQIGVYAPGSSPPDPMGPECGPHSGATGVDGLQFVFEARGTNFSVVAYPPSDIAKSIDVGPLWKMISERTTLVADAAGLDKMQFTVDCG